jgi:hypothetical protein
MVFSMSHSDGLQVRLSWGIARVIPMHGDWRGIEFEVDPMDDAMAVTRMKMTMNMMNECSEVLRSSRAELRRWGRLR